MGKKCESCRRCSLCEEGNAGKLCESNLGTFKGGRGRQKSRKPFYRMDLWSHLVLVTASIKMGKSCFCVCVCVCVCVKEMCTHAKGQGRTQKSVGKAVKAGREWRPSLTGARRGQQRNDALIFSCTVVVYVGGVN